MVQLNSMTQFSCVLALITLVVVIIICSHILQQAIKTKIRILYISFLMIFFLYMPWYSFAVGYIYWIFTGDLISYELDILIGTLGIPIFAVFWIYFFFSLRNPEKIKLSLIGIMVYSIPFIIYVLYYLFIATGAPIKDMLGTEKTGPLDTEYSLIINIFFAIGLILFIITAYYLSFFLIKQSKINKNPIVQWKGIFFFLAVTSFIVATIGDNFFYLEVIPLLIIRIILMLSSILFYFGFTMPNWLKNRILSKSEQGHSQETIIK